MVKSEGGGSSSGSGSGGVGGLVAGAEFSKLLETLKAAGLHDDIRKIEHSIKSLGAKQTSTFSKKIAQEMLAEYFAEMIAARLKEREPELPQTVLVEYQKEGYEALAEAVAGKLKRGKSERVIPDEILEIRDMAEALLAKVTAFVEGAGS